MQRSLIGMDGRLSRIDRPLMKRGRCMSARHRLSLADRRASGGHRPMHDRHTTVSVGDRRVSVQQRPLSLGETRLSHRDAPAHLAHASASLRGLRTYRRGARASLRHTLASSRGLRVCGPFRSRLKSSVRRCLQNKPDHRRGSAREAGKGTGPALSSVARAAGPPYPRSERNPDVAC